MSQGLYNLHNHTPFSDGAYTIDEIVEAHLDCKEFETAGIGISDHLFGTPSSREVTNDREFERLFSKETRAYVEQVREARQRWAGKVRILCGAEINWPMNKTMLGCIREMLTGIDYVLFEYADWAGLTTLANQARRWPCPVGLAHTVVAEQFPTTSMDQVVRTVANARMFYEISSKFLPLDEHDRWFNLLPNHRVFVTIGTDTHDDLSVIRDVPKLHEYAKRRGLGEKILVPAIRDEAKTAVSA
ncbi:MAG: PHP domain-containing protein [Phycisphaerae bacterium]|jgi:histidinol phosphatase-like PHP family hydrolase